MMHVPHAVAGGASTNAIEYRAIFVRRVHQLVRLGYERLHAANHSRAQEPAITGDLHAAIDNVLDSPTEDWMRLYSVHDDPAEDDGQRKGKKRKRIDLRIDSAFNAPRTRFRFEAKRLGKRHSVAMYLGSEGLGCFLHGDYARGEDHAGMLGYVQSADVEDWAEKLKAEFDRVPAEYSFDVSASFRAITLEVSVGRRCYQSKHSRSAVGRDITIDHILLQFH